MKEPFRDLRALGLADDSPYFVGLYQVVLDRNQIAEDGWMMVYKCRWDVPATAPGPPGEERPDR